MRLSISGVHFSPAAWDRCLATVCSVRSCAVGTLCGNHRMGMLAYIYGKLCVCVCAWLLLSYTYVFVLMCPAAWDRCLATVCSVRSCAVG